MVVSQAPGVDIRVVAERVAEVVNRKLGPVIEQVNALERRVRNLELLVEAMHSRDIESVVRAVLSVKLSELGPSQLAKLGESISIEMEKRFSALASTLDRLAAIVEGLERRIEELEASRSSEEGREIQSLREAVASFSAALSDLINRLAKLETRVQSLERSLSELSSRLNEVATSVSAAAQYSKQLHDVIMERLRSIQEEEEGLGGES